MPKLRRPYNRHEDLQRTIYGAMGYQDKTMEDMARVLGVKSRQTAASKIRNPEKMTLGDLRRLCLDLGIPAEEARALIKF